ncbi:OmpA family protein [Caulobacter sp. KR2-114]|uniref:OmpA family protein n=1 Tax=Caulobacter sp. KR2-114 TaxID=3400912 RepID=UPI003BFD67FE
MDVNLGAVRRAAASATVLAAILATAALGGCASAPKMHMPAMFAPPVCDDFSVSIYFEAESAALSPEAQALIRSAAGHARRCDVKGIDVVGLADAQGAPDANLKLSQDRAAAVTAALAARGLDHVPISTTGVGDEGAQTAGGLVRPMRRRANVTFHLARRPRT